MNDPVVRIRQVGHHFGEGDFAKQVLFDINMDVMPGEIIIMTGPSGSGKTTLLTLIGGLRSVQSGRLEVNGTELSALNHLQLVEIRRSIGFIFQAHNLFESLTAYQNVKMALDLQDWNEDQKARMAEEMLTDLGLAERIHYKPNAMSGGQKQRVAVARALVNGPRLILADEPTASLDKDSGRDVVNLLQKLAKEEHSASLIVTHDNRILDVADRIVNMVDGRVISDVNVEESVIICEFLAKCSVFSEFTPSVLSGVAEKMSRETHPPETVLIRQGDEGDKFYLIRRGSANVIVDGEARATLAESEFFGEAALITGEPRNATVVAREEIELYTLDKAEFRAALERSPTFEEQLLKVFFQRQS